LFAVVNGPPGSGKTTLGRDLAVELGLPFVSKDVIKEALMAVWGVPNVEASRRLGRAAIAAMLAIASDSAIGAVLEANFKRSLAEIELNRLDGLVVEVFCRCPRDLCRARYRERSENRDPGHLDSERRDEELWNEETVNPVAGGWPVIEVDTSTAVDLAWIVDSVSGF
jgi:adenylate kinase family enzyme